MPVLMIAGMASSVLVFIVSLSGTLAANNFRWSAPIHVATAASVFCAGGFYTSSMHSLKCLLKQSRTSQLQGEIRSDKERKSFHTNQREMRRATRQHVEVRNSDDEEYDDDDDDRKGGGRKNFNHANTYGLEQPMKHCGKEHNSRGANSGVAMGGSDRTKGKVPAALISANIIHSQNDQEGSQINSSQRTVSAIASKTAGGATGSSFQASSRTRNCDERSAVAPVSKHNGNGGGSTVEKLNRRFWEESLEARREKAILRHLEAMILLSIVMAIVVAAFFLAIAVRQFETSESISQRWNQNRVKYRASDDVGAWLGVFINAYFLWQAK